jgi:hypothetical protein
MNIAQLMSKRKADKQLSRILETKLTKLSTIDVAGCGCEKKKIRYNFKGKKKLYCKSHQQDGMINVTQDICEAKECTIRALFNEQGLKKGKFCAKHKESTMIDVINKTCEYLGCKTHPIFNSEGQTKGKFCSDHKEANMINVKNKTCEYLGCDKQPTFNDKGETKGKFCADHKDANMIDVLSKTCEFEGCKNVPSFNVEGESNARFCSKHKDANMIDVKSKTCEFEGCKKGPSFNIEGESNARFCSNHKQTNMVNVKHKACEFKECKTRAGYGLPGTSKSRCVKHITDGMISDPKRKCSDLECKSSAHFGITIPLHCETHQEKDEENLCLRVCGNCNALEICNRDGLCFEYCINSELFKRSKHKKELIVKVLLENEIEQKMFSYDKTIDSACTKKRPDIVYDCGTHFVIIEIDENQHRYYDCEEKRILEITQACGMPCIFIRYNPDQFVDNRGIKSKISKSKREKTLVTWVKHSMKQIPSHETEFVRVLYLFYDGHDETNLGYEIVKI